MSNVFWLWAEGRTVGWLSKILCAKPVFPLLLILWIFIEWIRKTHPLYSWAICLKMNIRYWSVVFMELKWIPLFILLTPQDQRMGFFEKNLRNLLYKYLFVKTRMSTQISFLNHPLLPLNIVEADGHEKQLLHASKLAQILSNFRPNLPFSVSCGPSLLKIFCLSNFHWRIRTHTWRNLGWICVDQQAVDSFGKILMQTSNLFDWYWQLVKDWHLMGETVTFDFLPN